MGAKWRTLSNLNLAIYILTTEMCQKFDSNISFKHTLTIECSRFEYDLRKATVITPTGMFYILLGTRNIKQN